MTWAEVTRLASLTAVDRSADGLLGVGVGFNEPDLWDRVLRSGRTALCPVVAGCVADIVFLLKYIFQRHNGGEPRGFCGVSRVRRGTWWVRFFDRGNLKGKIVRGLQLLNRTMVLTVLYA